MDTAKITLRLSWGYLLAFGFLVMLCGTSHEFVHHFVAALLCGCFGHKTFNNFDVCSVCGDDKLVLVVSNLAGPAFTFGLVWYGVWLLRRPDERRRQLGFALIFANFTVNRLLFVWLNMNDEQYADNIWFGPGRWTYWLTVAAVYLVGVPPLYFAYRAIANRRAWLWFLGFFLLPFVFVVAFAGFFLEFLMLQKWHVLAGEMIGIPYLVILVELLCLAGYAAYRRRLGGGPLRTAPV